MVKKITLVLFFIMLNLSCFSQTSIGEDAYNGFSSRSFMKFNNFMTVPTFSLLHRETSTIEAISRSSNIEFEDASRLHVISYSGKMRENVGAGIAFFQQEIGVFKDFGAMANYAYQLKLGAKNKLTFGFNFFYSRRGIDQPRVLSNGTDPLINNYQDKPVVVLQPAATFSFGNFDVGVFFENLGDFNLKTSNLVTSFADKTISGHAAYSYKLKTSKGLFENTTLRLLGIARRSKVDGFSYAGTFLVDLPKAGWIKAGYDKLYGLNAGFGVNLNQRLSIGFAYEKQENLSGTNEVGLIYRLGRKRGGVKITLPTNTPEPIERRKEEYENPEHNDLSKEIRIMQDSVDVLNKKVNEVLRTFNKDPDKVVKEATKEKPRNNTNINNSSKDKENNNSTTPTEVKPKEEKDQSLPRRKDTPWREKEIVRTGGGGTMYYVAFDQFKDINKAKDLVKKYKKRKLKVRYVKDPKYNKYVVYYKRFGKKDDANEIIEEVNGTGKKGVEKDGDTKKDNDISSLKEAKEKSSIDNLYLMKITLGAQGETYKEPKPQPRARVTTVRKIGDLEEGYYLQVGVFSKKAYADRLLDELQADGINADYYLNPKTGNRHVYIHKTNDRAEIIRLYNSNLNGSYYDIKNIIRIR